MFSVFATVTGNLFVTQLRAATPGVVNIDSGWQFRALTPTKDQPAAAVWHAATVPGVVQTDLLSNKLIPDPFFQDNEYRLQWIGDADWEYRTTFLVDAATLARQHLDLAFDGLDTFADVYVNDKIVLHADNMFRSWRVPVKGTLVSGSNTLRIVFHSPIQFMMPKVKALAYVLPAISTINGGNEEGIPTAPYTRKAPYNYGWDWGPRFMTIGIWKPVRLEAWDALRIENFHIQQRKIGKEVAELSAELDIDASQPGVVKVEVTNDHASGKSAKNISQEVMLDAGMNHVSLPFRVSSPQLWYPVGYGPQERYKFSASLREGKNELASAEVKTGLRSVELRRDPDQWGKGFTFVINGIPIFAKGANVIPFDSFMTRVTPAQHRKFLLAARDAHMNMLRDWGGGYYESDDYYDTADELGILIWQEFMFGGDMVPGDEAFQENVREEAIQQVKRLRDHPSVVLWCGNNEVEAGWQGWGDRQAFKLAVNSWQRERVWQDYVVLFRDVLKSVVEKFGNAAPYWPSSPGSNFDIVAPGQEDGDMHYWQVWHALYPIDDYTKQFPRFMSEFGFQSFPEMKTIRTFATPEDFDIRSATMQSHQKNKGGNERILTYMLREYHEPKDFASFIYLSQVQQAEAIKIGAEHLRRQRPRTMGALYWQLNDCWPVASWSSIDYYGNWKALQYYTRHFYDDLLVSPWEHDGKVDIYVVSDKMQSTGGTLRVRLMDFYGKTLSQNTQAVQAPAQSSAVYQTLDEKQLLTGADAKKVFLAVDLMVEGASVSRNLVFFDTVRNLELPEKPRISTSLSAVNGGYLLTLTSPALARHVFVSFGDLDVQLSDNYVDVLPNETVTLKLKSASNSAELRGALKLMSLMEAFETPAQANPVAGN
ncbi:MAG: glycoside hydrolase family 2 protein [Acidobacteriaceae bacterium]